jgi:hypothetical protein
MRIEHLDANEAKLLRLDRQLVLNDTDLDNLAGRLVLSTPSIPSLRSRMLGFTLVYISTEKLSAKNAVM